MWQLNHRMVYCVSPCGQGRPFSEVWHSKWLAPCREAKTFGPWPLLYMDSTPPGGTIVSLVHVKNNA